jgi:NADPH-dependent curcumin reductase CurA
VSPRSPLCVIVFQHNRRLYNYGISVVLRSENSEVKAGDHLYGTFSEHFSICLGLWMLIGSVEFQQYTIESDPSKFRILVEDSRIPWSVYVGALGMPGHTAYSAWKVSSNLS